MNEECLPTLFENLKNGFPKLWMMKLFGQL